MKVTIQSAQIEQAKLLAALISSSHKDVAARFGLTRTNCPKHPSFCTPQWVENDFARGEHYFIASRDNTPVGCVAYENPEPGLAYLNRLSVIPNLRRRGTGTILVQHVIDHAAKNQISTISIGIIAAYTELRNWYIQFGFQEGAIQSFPHLPFEVAYLHYS